MANKSNFTPGMRLIIRDEEWLLRRVDQSTSGDALTVVGVSSLTQGQRRVFLTDLEQKIEIVDPRQTKFVEDLSPKYRNSRLFIESQLRQKTPTDDRIYVGHKAAIDQMQFQFTPAIKALRAPRARILIADAVGLGKTIECGILLAELIKRGRGKRILALTVKSMMTQFQKELWSRFSIPLVRLDSVGIQRVRNKIPANANPFYYYDKAIVSIDTLKRAGEYRNYLQHCYWDVIVIDEAHNVAERGHSQRSELAKLVSTQCDSLVMLSATPHDGRRRSFASLIDMLDPTAIADPDAYTAEDVQGLFTRRFKKDVAAEVRKSFPERIVEQKEIAATDEEEDAFDFLARIEFKRLDQRRKKGDFLFKTTLEKALFSSPDACRETIKNRLKTLERELDKAPTPEARADAETLRKLDALVAKITPEKFSRYRLLLDMLTPTGKSSIGWTPRRSDDRLVIFAERVATVNFLVKRLRADLGLSEKEVIKLDASLGDVAIMEAVSKFGVESEPTRVLVCTDVASEGINLHYCCHRLVHFDTPWSLITFQQRNGRIDRYGQEKRPEIRYLSVQSQNEKIRGDLRILELLTKKDQEVVASIGDPSEFTGRYDAESEERVIAEAIEGSAAPSSGSDLSFLDKLFGAQQADPMDEVVTSEAASVEKIVYGTEPSLYESDYDYLLDALKFINSAAQRRVTLADDLIRYETEKAGIFAEEKSVRITPNKSLAACLKYLPGEVVPESGAFYLCSSARRVKEEYGKCLKLDGKWPEVQYLWNEHPVVQFLNETVLTAFGRMRAPFLTVDKLTKDETLFVLSAIVPNKQSQPVVSQYSGVLCRDGAIVDAKPFEEWIEKLGLAGTLYNPSAVDHPNEQVFRDLDAGTQKELSALLPRVVERVAADAIAEARRKGDELQAAARAHKAKLDDWRERKLEYIGGEERGTLFSLADVPDAELSRQLQKAKQAELDVARVFDDHWSWHDNAATIAADSPSVSVIAALKGVF